MKKLTFVLLSAGLALSLAACGADSDKVGTSTTTRITDTPTSVTAPSSAPTSTEAVEQDTTTTEDGVVLLPTDATTEDSSSQDVTTTTTEGDGIIVLPPAEGTFDSEDGTTTGTTSITTTGTTTEATATTKKPTTTTTTKKPTTTTNTTKKPTITTTTTASDPWGDSVGWDSCDACGETVSDLEPSCPHCGVAYYQCPQCRRYTHSVENDCVGCMCGRCGMNFYHCSDCGRNVEKTLDVCPHCGTKKPTTTTRPTIPADPSLWEFTEEELRFIEMVNEARKAEGLPALKPNGQLRQAAAIRAEEIAQKFDHHRPNGYPFWSAMDELGMRFSAAAENLVGSGRDDKPIEELHQVLMESEGHRANILSTKRTDIAIAIYRANGWVYAVQLFIKPFEEP